jgi:hypothetical protein
MTFPHWQFFESVDEELLTISRYVEFCSANFQTHSIELARLYLSVCSEIDVVAKLVCDRISPGIAVKNIIDYRACILQKYPNFSGLKIELPNHNLAFIPWEAWGKANNPAWWQSYNNVKHERSKFYQEANLGNVLAASAGLLVVLAYFHQPELYLPSPPIAPNFRILRFERRYANVLAWGYTYSFPDFGRSS